MNFTYIPFFFGVTKSGLYIITCLTTQRHYIGQSSNVNSRLLAHKNKLKRNIHENIYLQQDFNIYGQNTFLFKKLLFGTNADLKMRRHFEVLILDTLQPNQRYNKYNNWIYREPEIHPLNLTVSTRNQIKQTVSASVKETNRRKPVVIDGYYYESLSEASQKLNLSRKTIRQRCNNKQKFNSFQWFN